MSEKIRGYFLVKASMIEKPTGISQKIHSQILAMNNNGLNCKLYKQKFQRKQILRIKKKIERYLPWGNVNPFWENIADINDVSFIYFRHPKTIYKSMLKQLRNYKKQNPDLKVYMEIPTYPYDYEYTGIKNKYLLKIDKNYRIKLNGLVDVIFVSDSMGITDGKLFGVDCVRFINGYDVKNTKIINHKKGPANTIVLTCVAMFSFWHGYERLLYGLKKYLNSDNCKYTFKINFVGEGPELDFYKSIVYNYNLDEFVTFHGKKFKNDLNKIYEKTDIGISCLGCYKKRIDIIGDLKTREYLAKGIPTVSGCRVDLFKDGIDIEYYREIPNDNSPVDMEVLIEFFEFIEKKRQHEDIEEIMHEYSLSKFDYDKTILPIVTKIIETTCIYNN